MNAERVLMMVQAFSEEVDRAVRHSGNPYGGQRVPFHGDFAQVGPNALGKLQWWARELVDAATDPALNGVES